MNEQEIRDVVVSELTAIAPELDPASLKGAVLLRNQVDLDSFDWLNFLVALHKRLNVDIPEQDYRKLDTLDTVVAYLKAKVA
jgi:acyl carrier protein